MLFPAHFLTIIVYQITQFFSNLDTLFPAVFRPKFRTKKGTVLRCLFLIQGGELLHLRQRILDSRNQSLRGLGSRPQPLSTSALCASMIAAGIFSNAGSEMPAVSLWLSTSIFAILVAVHRDLDLHFAADCALRRADILVLGECFLSLRLLRGASSKPKWMFSSSTAFAAVSPVTAAQRALRPASPIS